MAVRALAPSATGALILPLRVFGRFSINLNLARNRVRCKCFLTNCESLASDLQTASVHPSSRTHLIISPRSASGFPITARLRRTSRVFDEALSTFERGPTRSPERLYDVVDTPHEPGSSRASFAKRRLSPVLKPSRNSQSRAFVLLLISRMPAQSAGHGGLDDEIPWHVRGSSLPASLTIDP